MGKNFKREKQELLVAPPAKNMGCGGGKNFTPDPPRGKGERFKISPGLKQIVLGV